MVTDTASAKRTGAGLACVQGERLLSVEEVAEWLGVPVGTIYAWRYRSTGPASYKVGRHVRFRRDDVESWLEEQRCEPAPPPMLHQLLGASPVRKVARTLTLPRTGRRTTIALPESLVTVGFCRPWCAGRKSPTPPPHRAWPGSGIGGGGGE